MFLCVFSVSRSFLGLVARFGLFLSTLAGVFLEFPGWLENLVLVIFVGLEVSDIAGTGVVN